MENKFDVSYYEIKCDGAICVDFLKNGVSCSVNFGICEINFEEDYDDGDCYDGYYYNRGYSIKNAEVYLGNVESYYANNDEVTEEQFKAIARLSDTEFDELMKELEDYACAWAEDFIECNPDDYLD